MYKIKTHASVVAVLAAASVSAAQAQTYAISKKTIVDETPRAALAPAAPTPKVVRKVAPSKTTHAPLSVTKTVEAPKAAPKRVVQQDQLLLKMVKGFVLTADPKKIVPGGMNVAGVKEHGLDIALPAAGKKLLNARVGKPLTKKSLQTIINGLVKAYRNSGVQIASVVTPQQDITNGTVQVLVILGRMGKLSVEGANYFDEDIYTRYFSSREGEILTTGKVVEDLRYMNRSLFRNVDLIYKPGTAYGQTDVILNANEVRPRSVYAGVENTGSGGTFGEERVITGFQIGNLWRRDHQLSYQYTTNTKSSDLNAHFLDYRIPLRGRQEVQFKYSQSDYSGLTQGDTLKQEGDNTSVGVHYYRQVRRWRGFAGDLHLAFEQKDNQGNVIFGGVDVPSQDTEYTQATIGWVGDKLDTDGRTRASIDLVQSVSGETGLEDAKRDVDHTYLKGSLDKRYFHANGGRLILKGNVQITDDTLPSGEQMYLGGRNSVRGWKQGFERVDQGLAASATYQMKDIAGNGRGHELRPYVFADYAMGKLNDATDTDAENKSMGSVGVGAYYQFRRNVTLDLSYGHQVHEDNIAEDDDDGHFHGSLVVRY